MSTSGRTQWVVGLVTLTSATLVYGCGGAPPKPAEPTQTTFASPAIAAAALFEAAQKNDQAALLALFGPSGRELIASGDAAEDQASRDNFVQKYQKMHRIGLDAENRTALFIGAENWPLPIPLVNKDGKWAFDTDAGKREVIYRRVGRNETAAIQICEQLAAAQKEYFKKPHDGDATHQYAQHFVSTAGHHDGLFWPAEAGDTDSPIGPLLAFSSSETTAKAAGNGPVPFHGYYFRMLRAQGKDMPGGAKSFVVKNHMTGGFGFVAYPADYRSSGVMTFVVGSDGVVYQADLGDESATVAKAMTELNRDGTWVKAETAGGS